MQISHLFEISPFLAISFCVCLGTVVWCIIMIRRGCHYIADRFLIGFIGLLTIYQSIQILRRGGMIVLPHMRQVDEALDMLVNSTYLIAALLLRMSSKNRFAAMSRLRLVEAETAVPHPIDTSAQVHSSDPRTLEKIRQAVPLLSANALKLYLYFCFHADRLTGALEMPEEELAEAVGIEGKSLSVAFKELKDKGLCAVELERANSPVRIAQAGC